MVGLGAESPTLRARCDTREARVRSLGQKYINYYVSARFFESLKKISPRAVPAIAW